MSTCDGLGTSEATCVNTCGSGEFWDAGLTTCVTCTVTDGTCASSAEHGGFVSTCDGLGTSEATCVNTCGSGEFWDAGLDDVRDMHGDGWDVCEFSGAWRVCVDVRWAGDE